MVEECGGPGPFGREARAQDVVRGHDLAEKAAIVTGGGGLGLETVRALATAGATVTIAVRNLDAARQAAEAINAALGREAVSTGQIDLASLASVRAFAAAWGDRPLTILINNAGIMGAPFARTVDGFEMHMGVNHLGHFLLSRLLTPNLQRGAPSRVVHLSSGAHLRSPVDLEDWNYERQDYDPRVAYARSKSATALTAVAESDRQLEQGIASFSVMPGVIQTDLFRFMEPAAKAEAMARLGSLSKTPEQGAATSVWAAVSTTLDGKGGLYLENCQIADPATSNPPAGVAAYVQDSETASRLWRISCDAVDA